MQYHYEYEGQPALYNVVTGYGAGNVAHEALELFFARQSADRTWENLEKDIWTGATEVKEKDKRIIDDVLEFMKGWHSRAESEEEVIAVYDGKSALELKFTFILPNGGEVTGYIDKIVQIDEDTIEVVDYKSNQMIFTREEIDNSIQLAIYTIAAKQLFPNVKTVNLRYDFLRHTDVTRMPFEDNELEIMIKYLQHMWDVIKNDEEPIPSVDADSCRWCNSHRSCKAYQAAIKDNALPDQGQTLGELMFERRDLLGRFKAIEGRKKEIDKYLLGRIKSTDQKMIEVPGIGKIKFTQRKKTEYNNRVVQEVFKERMYLVSEIKKTKVDKLIKELAPSDRQKILDSAHLSYGAGYITPTYDNNK